MTRKMKRKREKEKEKVSLPVAGDWMSFKVLSTQTIP